MTPLGFRGLSRAMAAIFLAAELAVAQQLADERIPTFVGEGNGPIQVIDSDGAVSYVQPAEIAAVILVQKDPPIPDRVAKPDDEAVPVIEFFPEPAAEPVDSPESIEDLTVAAQAFLTQRAVPRHPDFPQFPLVPEVPELAEKQETARQTIEAGLVQQAIPNVARPARLAPASVYAESDPEILDAAETVLNRLAAQVVPPLPDSVQKRTARTRKNIVDKRGLSGSEIRAQTPLHLLQTPPPQLPPSRRDDY